MNPHQQVLLDLVNSEPSQAGQDKGEPVKQGILPKGLGASVTSLLDPVLET